MGIKSRYEYLKEILLRYKYATRAQMKNILDEFCTNCGYNRKYAIRLLNLKNKSKPKKVSKRGRKKFYHDPLIAQVLTDIGVVTNLACSKGMKAIIPLFLPQEVEKLMVDISTCARHRFNKRLNVNQALFNGYSEILLQFWDELPERSYFD